MDSAQHSGGLTTDIVVYIVLLAISGLQIVIAYTGNAGRGLLTRLLVVAGIQAVIAVFFFMHLRWEKRNLVWFIAVFVLFVLFAMQYSWSDSFRLLVGAPFSH